MHPPTSLRERQKRDRRARIYSEAMKLFRTQGFAETTVVDIAGAAGVSRGTFFNYYPYKEAILLEHTAVHLHDLEAQVGALLARDTLPVEVLYAVFDDLARFVEANRTLMLPLGYELLNPDPARSKAAFEALPLAAIIGGILAKGQEAGLVRRDVSRERLARTLADTFFLNALQWAAYHTGRSIAGELRKSLRLALEGMTTPIKDVSAGETLALQEMS